MNLTFCGINGNGQARREFFKEAKNVQLERSGKWYQEGAKGIYTYFKLYDDGGLAPKDYPKAAKYYKKAYEQGNDESAFRLANMYFKGNGVVTNYEKAFSLASEAFEKGYKGINAWYMLGVCYKEGIGTVKNPLKALEYYYPLRFIQDESLLSIKNNAIADFDEIREMLSTEEYLNFITEKANSGN